MANITRIVRSLRQYRNTVNELSRYSERELADLGIARTQIRALARNATHRRSTKPLR